MAPRRVWQADPTRSCATTEKGPCSPHLWKFGVIGPPPLLPLHPGPSGPHPEGILQGLGLPSPWATMDRLFPPADQGEEDTLP